MSYLPPTQGGQPSGTSAQGQPKPPSPYWHNLHASYTSGGSVTVIIQWTDTGEPVFSAFEGEVEGIVDIIGDD